MNNTELWKIYGSELCAGDMLKKEEELMKKIAKLKSIERWEKAGLLERFREGSVEKECAPLFEEETRLLNEFQNNDVIKMTVQLEKGIEQNIIGLEVKEEDRVVGNIETYNKETGIALINITGKINMKLINNTPNPI